MTIDEAIKHCEEVAEENKKFCFKKDGKGGYFNENADWNTRKCAEEHHQLAAWLRELKVFKSRKGEWLRMSDESKDDRYKRSYCGNVVHYKDKMDLYTFNKWCGRCGSDNSRK